MSDKFILSPFQKFCIQWGVLIDPSQDRLSKTERILRTIQLVPILSTTVLTTISVLIADKKKAIESSTYLIICMFSLAVIAFAIRTKRFNRRLLFMVLDEFPSYNMPMPDHLKEKMAAIRTSYNSFTTKVIVSYLLLVLFEMPATGMVPLSAAIMTTAKLGSQSTQMVSYWFPGDSSKVTYSCEK